jgi:hypothetical protein
VLHADVVFAVARLLRVRLYASLVVVATVLAFIRRRGLNRLTGAANAKQNEKNGGEGAHDGPRPRARPSSLFRYFGEQSIDILPAHGVHESLDIGAGLGAEIDVIGVLVHVERQNGRAAGERVAVIGGPLIDELAVAWRPSEQNPAGTAAKRLAHGDEFGTPALV